MNFKSPGNITLISTVSFLLAAIGINTYFRNSPYVQALNKKRNDIGHSLNHLNEAIEKSRSDKLDYTNKIQLGQSTYDEQIKIMEKNVKTIDSLMRVYYGHKAVYDSIRYEAGPIIRHSHKLNGL